MSAFNDEKILKTFQELKNLEIENIASCVSKDNALIICKNSCSPPSETFNLWAQKLFKAYDLTEFTSKDWHNIFCYLRNTLNKFVENLDSLSDTSLKELNLWWLDSQELLKCLESIITSANVCIFSLILTFLLEIIIKTCKFTEKRNIKSILTIQQLVITMINNCMFKIPLRDIEDFEGFNKVVSSLCDVGALICSSDIKTSIETWRVVAKLSDRCNHYNAKSHGIQTKNAKLLQSNWHKTAIFGILKESSNILKLFLQEDSTSNDDNIIQVVQFYLKLLKVLVKNASDGNDTFPAIKQFFEFYTLCTHKSQFNQTKIYKINFFVKPGLNEIFSIIYKQPGVSEHILCHLQNDVDNFSSCDLIENYLHIIIVQCPKDLPNVNTVVEVLMSLYENLFEGCLIFIDCDKYSKILEYYVALTILDYTNELHKKLCKCVLNSKWIKAYTSMDILRVYYSYIFKNQTAEKNLHCLEYWLNIWNKLNNSTTSTIRQQKMLIESLLKTLLHNIPDSVVEQNCTNLQSIEIIMLACGKRSAELQQYFETNLINNLRKMQEYQIDQKSYRELINLLRIGLLNTDWLNTAIRENLVKTFTGLFAIAPSEIHRYNEFLNNCFNIFTNLNDKQLNHNVFQSLTNHLQHVENIWSVFLIEFLLKLMPQSENLLQSVKSAKLKQILNLLDYKFLVGYKNTTIDLQVFRHLVNNSNELAISSDKDIKQITKKLRLGESNFSNIKFILNEMNLQSQHLLNFVPGDFETTDYDLLNVIKNNIEKCLTK